MGEPTYSCGQLCCYTVDKSIKGIFMKIIKYTPTLNWNGHEYGLNAEADFRASLKFSPNTLKVFFPSDDFMTDKDDSQCFGWWSSYGGTLYLPRRSQNILICTKNLSAKELSYLVENFKEFGEFYDYGETLKWCYHSESV